MNLISWSVRVENVSRNYIDIYANVLISHICIWFLAFQRSIDNVGGTMDWGCIFIYHENSINSIVFALVKHYPVCQLVLCGRLTTFISWLYSNLKPAANLIGQLSKTLSCAQYLTWSMKICDGSHIIYSSPNCSTLQYPYSRTICYGIFSVDAHNFNASSMIAPPHNEWQMVRRIHSPNCGGREWTGECEVYWLL